MNRESGRPFVRLLAKKLYSPDALTFFKNVFSYVCRNVRYKLDPEGQEFVYRPATTVNNGIGDCKKMSVLIAAILKAAGYEPLLKHVFYNGEKYTHIYVIVPHSGTYVTLDPVNDCRYNQEVNYSRANVYNLKGQRMDLFTGAKSTGRGYRGFTDGIYIASSQITDDLETVARCKGIGATITAADLVNIYDLDEATAGIGARKRKQSGKPKKTKEERKENRKKVLAKFKKVGLAGPRGAFLGLLALNFTGIAGKLAQAWAKHPGEIENFWKKLGGDVNAFKKAIAKGAKTKIQGASTGVAVESLAATALPVLAAVATMLKKLGVVKGETAEKLDDAIEDAEDSVASGDVDPEKTQKETEAPEDKPPVTGSFAGNVATVPGYVNFLVKSPLILGMTAASFGEVGTAVSSLVFAGVTVYFLTKKFFS